MNLSEQVWYELTKDAGPFASGDGPSVEEVLEAIPNNVMKINGEWVAMEFPFGDDPRENSLHQDLRIVLNKHSVEKGSDTPDNILASYLIECLKTWNTITKRRDRYWGISPTLQIIS